MNKQIIEAAQHLNRITKTPGACKATVFENRIAACAIVLGMVGREAELALAACEIQNSQAHDFCASMYQEMDDE